MSTAKTLHERIQADEFRNKLPWARPSKDADAHAKYTAESTRLEALFVAALEEENGTGRLPEALRTVIYSKAYEEGHSSGRSEVALRYVEHAEVALAAYDAGVAAENARIFSTASGADPCASEGAGSGGRPREGGALVSRLSLKERRDLRAELEQEHADFEWPPELRSELWDSTLELLGEEWTREQLIAMYEERADLVRVGFDAGRSKGVLDR